MPAKISDNRRVSNGDQASRIAALAMKRGKSIDFTGYWQRHLDSWSLLPNAASLPLRYAQLTGTKRQ
jgi:hypothetical protein